MYLYFLLEICCFSLYNSPIKDFFEREYFFMDNLIKLIREINKNISIGNRIYGSFASNDGVNIIEHPILYSLLIFENLSQKDIADEYGLPKQTVNNIIKRLESEKIVELKTSDKDKRRKIICLTTKGREYVNEKLGNIIERENKAASIVGAEKLTKLNDLLIELNDVLKIVFEDKHEN